MVARLVQWFDCFILDGFKWIFHKDAVKYVCGLNLNIGGKSEEMYRRMWDSAVDGIHDYLLHISTPSGLHYIAEMFETGSASKINHKMDHLTCFLGGRSNIGFSFGFI